MRLDLPAPFSPSRPSTRPGAISKLTPCSSRTGPKSFVIPSNATRRLMSQLHPLAARGRRAQRRFDERHALDAVVEGRKEHRRIGRAPVARRADGLGHLAVAGGEALEVALGMAR